ncbi:MAG: DUF4349 domain-containing protein [Candidatus Desantisbacteria bacterium]
MRITINLLTVILVSALVITGSVLLTREICPLPQVLTQKKSLPKAGKMAEIELEAKKLSIGVARVTDEMMRFEGIVSQKEINGEEKTAWLVFKLPAAEFENAARTLEQIGGLRHSRLTTEDKTDVHMKLQTQLESLQASTARLVSSSAGTGEKLPDMLQIENKLKCTEREMGEIKGEMERLEDQMAYGLIFIRMYERRLMPLSYGVAFQKSIDIACQNGLDNCIKILGIIVFWILSSLPLLTVILILWLIAFLFQIRGTGRKNPTINPSQKESNLAPLPVKENKLKIEDGNMATEVVEDME